MHWFRYCQRFIAFWRRHRHHPDHSATEIRDLGMRTVLISYREGKFMATVSGTFTAPTKRKSGGDLALTDIDHFSLTRNAAEIDKLAPSGPTIPWSDTSPLSGADTYDVFTITKDGFTSDSSNDANVIIVTADPATAITDLTATVTP